jgi:hypothetical protein
VDWAAVSGPGRAVTLPTYAFQRQHYWPVVEGLAARVAAGGADGAGSAEEARFWAAVEGGDLAGLAGTLALQDQQRLAGVLPALASWRRGERDRSATGEWRYKLSWVPVPDPDPAPLAGTWLVIRPAQHDLAGHDPAQHDLAGHDPAQHDLAGHDPAQHDLAGHDPAQHDLAG